MSFWWIVLSALGAIPAFLLCCFVVGFVGGMAQSLGLQRKPRFRVIRYEEETE